MPKSKAKERVYLTEEEKKLLGGLLEEWNSKPDKKTRDAFIFVEALPKIQALDMSKYGPDIISTNKAAKSLWENRVQAVFTWFKNNKPYKDRAVFKLERKVPLRRVIGKLKADQIHEMVVAEEPDTQKGDKAYPGHFQKALTMLIKNLTTEEVEEMETIRGEWQTAGPPIDVRLKAAKKYSRKGIINAHQLLHKEIHDYIADIHVKSHGKRIKTFKEWKGECYVQLVQDMIGYANYVDAQRKENAGQEVDPVDVPITFEKGPGNLPLLPPEAKGIKGMEVAKIAQEIIRAYFLRHYQLATGCETVRTPWAVIGEDPSKFFDPSCLPAGFKFQDPSRMGISVKALLSHLRQRQTNLGVKAFQFHHVLHNNKLQPAEYPTECKTALISAGSITENIPPPDKISKLTKDANNVTLAGTADDANAGRETSIQLGSIAAGNVETSVPTCVEISGTTRMPPHVPMPVSMEFPNPLLTMPTPWPPTTPMTPLPMPQHGHYEPWPPHMMPYYRQFMSHHFPRGDPTAAHLFGIQSFLGSREPDGLENIDTQLLPPGAPPFFRPHTHVQGTEDIHYSTETAYQDPSGVILNPPAESSVKRSISKTPKRKRSQSTVHDDYTPSRSTRKRKPSKKILESMAME